MSEFFSTPDNFGEIRASELHSSLAESLVAQGAETLDPQSGVSAVQLWRRARSAIAGGDLVPGLNAPDAPALPEDLQLAQDLPESVPDVAIDDAKARVKQAGLEGQLSLPDQDSIKAPVLDLMIQEAQEHADRNAAIARGPQGFLPGALGFATAIGAGMIDPINMAAFSIPVLGEARMGRIMANAGDSILARTGARLMQGAAQGAAGGAALAPADWWLHTADGRDYTMADALKSVVLSAGMGAGFHAAFGGFGDLRSRMNGAPLEGSPEDLVSRGLLADPGAMTQEEAPTALPGEEVPGILPAQERAQAGVVADGEPPEGLPAKEAPGIADEPEPAQTGAAESIPDAWATARDDFAADNVDDVAPASNVETTAAGDRHPAEVLADLPQSAQEDVVRAAIADMIEGRPVRVGEMLNIAADIDPRIAESVREPGQGLDQVETPAVPSEDNSGFSFGRAGKFGQAVKKLPGVGEGLYSTVGPGRKVRLEANAEFARKLADGRLRRLAEAPPEFEDPDLVAESKEASEVPEIASLDSTKAPTAAEASAMDADALLKDMLPRLSANEREAITDALNRVDDDKRAREQIIRDGAACLAEAAA